MEQSSVLKIAVQNPWRSSQAKQGTTWFFLHQNQRLAAIANLFAPDHNRSEFGIFCRNLELEQPDFILCLGRMLHDQVVQDVAPHALRDLDEGERTPAPEVEEARLATDIYEARVLHVLRLLSERIFVRMRDAAGPQCNVLYIPASEGTHQTFPPEANIKMILEHELLPKVAKWRTRQAKLNLKRRDEDQVELPDPDEVPVVPIDRKDFGKLLGLDQESRITVLPFGSSIMVYCTVWVSGETPLGLPAHLQSAAYQDNTIDDSVPDADDNIPDQPDRKSGEATDNNQPIIGEVRLDQKTGRKFRVTSRVRFIVGKNKVMHPISEANTLTQLDNISTYMSFPGNLSNGWFTKRVHSGIMDRALFMFGQIGMMFDRKRVNWGDAKNERLASGYGLWENVQGTLHGSTSVFMPGQDRRRGIYFWGHCLWEKKAQPLSRQRHLSLD